MKKIIDIIANIIIGIIIILYFLILGNIYMNQIETSIAISDVIEAVKVLSDTVYYDQKIMRKDIMKANSEISSMLQDIEEIITNQSNINEEVCKISKQEKNNYEELSKLKDNLIIFREAIKEPDYKLILESTVTIFNNEEMTIGSGVCINYKNNKYILSAYHVYDGRNMEDNEVYKKILSNGSSRKIYVDDGGKLIKLDLVIGDKLNDLILFKTQEPLNTMSRYVTIEDIEIKTGSKVWACGNPMEISDALTYGIIVKESKDKSIFLIDAPIWFGNSGGGIFNKDTQLMGICSQTIFSTRHELGISQSYGLIVSIDTIIRFLSQLK